MGRFDSIDPSQIDRSGELTVYTFLAKKFGHKVGLLNDATIHVYDVERAIRAAGEGYGAKTFVGGCEEVAVGVSVDSGNGQSVIADQVAFDGIIDLEPEREPDRMPTAQRYPWPKERFRYEFQEPEQSTVPQDPPQVEQLDNGLLIVIEDPDPWAHDTEPVFWTD